MLLGLLNIDLLALDVLLTVTEELRLDPDVACEDPNKFKNLLITPGLPPPLFGSAGFFFPVVFVAAALFFFAFPVGIVSSLACIHYTHIIQ